MELIRGCMAEEEKEEACVEREFDAFFGCFRHLEVEFVTSCLNSGFNDALKTRESETMHIKTLDVENSTRVTLAIDVDHKFITFEVLLIELKNKINK